MDTAPGRPNRWAARARWLVWLLYATAWTAALLAPSPDEYYRAFRSWLGLPPPPPAAAEMQEFIISKTLHVSAYFVLTLLTAWLQVRRPWRWAMLALLSLHAFGTELGQMLVETRHPSLRDVGLDHAGIAAGILLSWAWWRARP